MTITLRETRELINQALTPINSDWYSLDVVFNKDVETVKIHKKYIENIVQDVLNGNPRCTLYAKAVRRLVNEEIAAISNGKYKDMKRTTDDTNPNVDTYDDIREDLLNPHIPVDPNMFSRLKKLGFNPTGAIDYDNNKSYNANVLIRKQWTSRSDTGKSVDEVRLEMYDALRRDPKSAFTTNRYLPSVIEYYKDRE